MNKVDKDLIYLGNWLISLNVALVQCNFPQVNWRSKFLNFVTTNICEEYEQMKKQQEEHKPCLKWSKLLMFGSSKLLLQVAPKFYKPI